VVNFTKTVKPKEIKDSNFTDGYAVQKFRNVTVSGVRSDKAGNFSDSDFLSSV
jgi:hypothetical protein